MFPKFVDSPFFTRCVRSVFNKIDKDKSGSIDATELTIAMCHLHYKIAKKSPGVTDPPTASSVEETMKSYDMDASGTLNYDEFLQFARKWFDKSGPLFFRRLVVTSFISMVVLPESAAILHREVPVARQVPKMVFKVLFGVVFKLVANNLPARS